MVELTIVFGTFEPVIHRQTIAQMRSLVGAAVGGGVNLAVWHMIDGNGRFRTIKVDQIFGANGVGRKGANPLWHGVLFDEIFGFSPESALPGLCGRRSTRQRPY